MAGQTALSRVGKMVVTMVGETVGNLGRWKADQMAANLVDASAPTTAGQMAASRVAMSENCLAVWLADRSVVP